MYHLARRQVAGQLVPKEISLPGWRSLPLLITVLFFSAYEGRAAGRAGTAYTFNAWLLPYSFTDFRIRLSDVSFSFSVLQVQKPKDRSRNGEQRWESTIRIHRQCFQQFKLLTLCLHSNKFVCPLAKTQLAQSFKVGYLHWKKNVEVVNLRRPRNMLMLLKNYLVRVTSRY